MRYVGYLIIGGLAIAALGGWTGEGVAASAGPPTQLSQQVTGGGVTVTATLVKGESDGTTVKLAFNTHSVNLDGYDLQGIAALRDDKGKTYPVEAVEQASGGGHHRQAVLHFGKVNSEATSIELIVKDVAGVKERTFRWSTTE